MKYMSGFLTGFGQSLNQYLASKKAKTFEVGYFQGYRPSRFFISINGYFFMWRKK